MECVSKETNNTVSTVLLLAKKILDWKEFRYHSRSTLNGKETFQLPILSSTALLAERFRLILNKDTVFIYLIPILRPFLVYLDILKIATSTSCFFGGLN